MQKFLNASTWNGFLGQPYPDAANLTTNAAIGSYLRRFSNTIKHPVGTASVGNSSTSVVGPNLLVKQATGLRIVDASVIVSNSFLSLSNAGTLTFIHTAQGGYRLPFSKSLPNSGARLRPD
jgi:choline dehydrogenase-like flavoprotein